MTPLDVVVVALGLLLLIWLLRLAEGLLVPLVALVLGGLVLVDLAHGGTIIRSLLDQFAQFIANLINTFIGGFKP